MKNIALRLALFASLMVVCVVPVFTVEAQEGPSDGGPPATARESAPFDVTGYWVSIVTEDWRWRMMAPPKGDYTGVPLNSEGRRVGDMWDPARDEAANEECRSYGAANIMRVPGRLHITWQDDETLRIEMDSGMQTRLLSFGVPRGTAETWQGVSTAEWESLQSGSSFFARGAGLGSAATSVPASLKIVTTGLRPGYIRKNGVPYSENAVLTEYFDVLEPEEGLSYLVVSTTLEDPTYLAEPMLTAVHFRKQPDATGWNPTPCRAR